MSGSDPRVAAIAAVDALDAAAEAPAPEAEAPAPEAEAPAPEAEAPAKETTLHARLARADRELQSLRSFRKNAVPLDAIRDDPLSVLQAAGYSPEKLLDLWLGSPAGASARPSAPQADGDTADLRRRVEELQRTLQQRETETSQERAQAAYRGTVEQIGARVQADGKWPLVARLASARHVSDSGGGSLDLAAEVAQAVYRQRVGALGPRATRAEIEDAAPSYDEILDLVEEHLGERKKAWSDDPAPAPKSRGGRSLPSTPATGTATKKPLSDADRRKRAIERLNELDSKARDG